MRKRPEQILRAACLVLAAVVVVRLAQVVLRVNPLAHVAVPALPSLPDDASANNKPTNGAPEMALAQPGTNHSPHPPQTNAAPEGTNGGKMVAAAEVGSASVARQNHAAMETNAAKNRTGHKPETNSALPKAPRMIAALHSLPAGMRPTGLPFGPPRMAGRKSPPLAPAIQARVDRITDSEILGPIIHPLPMALLGIAGDVAFLRAPGGQTGLVKPGDSLGEIKLLRIGVNRVLIEQDGKEKELTIFSGFGGESLLPKPTGTADETTPK